MQLPRFVSVSPPVSLVFSNGTSFGGFKRGGFGSGRDESSEYVCPCLFSSGSFLTLRQKLQKAFWNRTDANTRFSFRTLFQNWCLVTKLESKLCEVVPFVVSQQVFAPNNCRIPESRSRGRRTPARNKGIYTFPEMVQEASVVEAGLAEDGVDSPLKTRSMQILIWPLSCCDAIETPNSGRRTLAK